MELLVPGVILFLYMTGLFLASLVTRNNGVADVGYGIGFSVVLVSGLVVANGVTDFSLGLVAIVFLWSIRIASRIYRKNKGKPEDFRYKAWRDAWGKTFFVRSFFQIYVLQGSVIFIIVLPVLLSVLYGSVPSSAVLYGIGILISLTGLTTETFADRQLDAFLRTQNRTERIMKHGLWRYSRHPNYFGESLVWWGMGVATLTLHPYVLFSFVSPLLITFLLLRVSGIPMLEKRWAGDPEWEAYKAKTSAFIPLPPRRGEAKG